MGTTPPKPARSSRAPRSPLTPARGNSSKGPRAKPPPRNAAPSTRAARGGSTPGGGARRPAGTPKAQATDASRHIDQRLRELDDWRGTTLARMRELILAADPGILEEVKWRGTPVWSSNGIVCTGEVYARVVKLTFAHGAELPDPTGLFNASLDGGTRRAIDIREGASVDARAFRTLVKAAVTRNAARLSPSRARRTPPKPVRLLSGGNPQITKADGHAPVQAYIAALPGWKRELAQRLDALIVESVPDVQKAVKWNSPFYGVAGQGWFLGLHAFTRYLKVSFFRGTSLRPVPPGGTGAEARWIDLREGEWDEPRLRSWIEQAAALPGWSAGRKT